MTADRGIRDRAVVEAMRALRGRGTANDTANALAVAIADALAAAGLLAGEASVETVTDDDLAGHDCCYCFKRPATGWTEDLDYICDECAMPPATAEQAWDAAVASMRYEDGSPVEFVAVVNPYRTAH